MANKRARVYEEHTKLSVFYVPHHHPPCRSFGREDFMLLFTTFVFFFCEVKDVFGFMLY